MMCRRCGGLMVTEPIGDATQLRPFENHQESRCLNCGNIEDSVIQVNRLELRSTRNSPHDKICAATMSAPRLYDEELFERFTSPLQLP